MSVLGGGIGLYPSRNCSGGGNMMSSLTLFHRTGLGFMLSHFPVLGGGIGLYPSQKCSGGGNMMSSLTLFHGKGWVLCFPIFQFLVVELVSLVGSLTI